MPKAILNRLTEDLEEKAYDMIINGSKFDDIAKAIGLKNKQTFARYQMAYPEFQDLVQRALMAQCPFLEEQMLHITEDFTDKYARVQLEAISKILKFRDPKRYGDKVNIDVSLSIDISGALDRAQRRVAEITTTNVIAITAKNTKNENGD